ncbi:hypothetical protein [Novosphingobium sp. PASSN1]|uniref:lipopolysaccharide biosynthesis protein n=1 Tax=Novosphingobium sp. PASSN1 TaxID=2015561 RepID=UPI0025EBA2FC|nr:hypothetical protein [Novosphingobium sp. PASSN1]
MSLICLGVDIVKVRVRFAAKVASSLADQLILSGANFVLNVTLASSISTVDYGIFALVYSLVVLISILHSPFVGEPLTVFWPYNSNNIEKFKRSAFVYNLLVIAAAVLLLLFADIFIRFDYAYLSAFIWILISFSLMWLFRYFSYAQSRPGTGMIQSAIYAATLIGVVIALRMTGNLTGLTALWGLGAAGTAGAIYGTILHRVKLSGAGRSDIPTIITLAHYGKWSAPSGIANWATANILLVTMPIFGSAAEAGHLKAFLNVLLPFQQVLQGASQIALPVLARESTLGNTHRAKRLQTLFLIASLVGSLAVVGILLLFGREIYAVLYGQAFQVNDTLLLYGAALPVAMALIAALRTILRAHQHPQAVLMAYGIGIGAVGIIGVPIASVGNAATAVLVMSAIHVVIFMAMATSIVRLARTGPGREEGTLP